MNAEQPHERRICGAKTRAGTPCKRAPMANGRCNLHGGKSPSGMAHHGYKHGRHSKHLPQRLRQRYTEAVNDPDLISLHSELALLDTRITELTEAVDEAGGGELWESLGKAWNEFRDLQGTEDRDRIQIALNRVNRLIRDGAHEYMRWQEIRSTIRDRRRLASEERRRLVDLNQMMTVEQAMTGAAALLHSVRKNVRDRATLAAIEADFAAFMGPMDS